jgi:hypothetical protein
VEIIAFDDLGPEAVRRLSVQDFPVVAIIDGRGNNLYVSGPAAYLRSHAPYGFPEAHNGSGGPGGGTQSPLIGGFDSTATPL